jgi:Ran GTPase-activating protein (RanGAP) involved in mRNA processing and transport
VLKVNSTVEDLEMTLGMQNDGARAIGDALKVNTGLRILNLEQNHIGDRGVKGLYEGLKHNRTVAKLMFYKNWIGPNSGKVFGRMLKGLKEVDLRHNCFKDKGNRLEQRIEG